MKFALAFAEAEESMVWYRCIEIAKRSEAAGCDLLFWVLNPYKIPHERVMTAIELIGEHVIPALDSD